MANDLDKFTLQYQVDLKDSIRKLEELHKKMSAVKKEHSESAAKLKEFVSGASEELNKLVPGMNAVGVAARSMGAQFSVVAAAVAALAISVKAVMALREQFLKQHELGVEIGVSGARVEDYQRKFVKAGGGYVNRDQAAEGLKTFSKIGSAAYANPGGADARKMMQLGVKPGVYGGTPTGINEQLEQASKKLQGLRKDEVQALAMATGQNVEWLLALQKLGPAVGQITEQTLKELQERKAAEAEMDKLNKNISEFSEQMTRLEQKLGLLVLPAMTKFIGFLADMAGWFDKLTPQKKAEVGMALVNPAYAAGKAGSWIGGWLRDKITGKKDEPEAPKEMKPEEKAALEAEITQQDETNKKGKQQADQMSLIINQFAASVATFSSAINTQQAWAAWAGEIGKAGGVGKAANDSSGGKGFATSGGSSKYDDIIKQAASKYGVDPNLIKRVMSAESNFNPNAVSKAGATGLMQIMPANYKALGITNPNDPTQNIMGGTRLLSENLKHFGNEADALRAYNGGWDKRRWGNAETANYVNRVNSQQVGVGSGGGRGNTTFGESRNNLQTTQVQQTIATALGVPLEQIQQGGVSRGDAQFSYNALETGIQNKISGLKREASIPGRGQQAHAKLLNEIRDQERGLGLLRQYGPGVVAGQQEGGRQITIGERAILITVNGAGDPHQVAQAVNDEMARRMNDAINQLTTGTKG